MSISFYEASVQNYLQTLAATQGFLEKGLAYCKEMDVDPEEIVERRVFADMNPFRFQIHQVVLHSQGAVDAMKAGVLRVPGERERPKHTYAELQALIADAHAALAKTDPAEINALSRRPYRREWGTRHLVGNPCTMWCLWELIWHSNKPKSLSPSACRSIPSISNTAACAPRHDQMLGMPLRSTHSTSHDSAGQ